MAELYKTAAGRRAVEDAYRDCLAAWPTANRQLRLHTREGETFVVACGPRDAPPLVLLHGAMANAASWPALLDVAFLARGNRVYAVDTIGDSGFSAPSRPPLDGDAHAAWLDDVLDGLGHSGAAFAGASLGGFLAIDYASRRPHRATAVAAMCPAGLAPRRTAFVLPALALSMLGPWGRRRAMRLALGAPAEGRTPDQIRFARLMALVMRHMTLRTHALPLFADAALEALTMPVLAILGAKDRIVDSARTCSRLQASVPHAQIRWLPSAGHLIRGQTAPLAAFLDEAWTA